MGPQARCSVASLYQQQAALLIAVERIYSVEQPLPLDQPWLKVEADIEHEDDVLGFEIAPNWGMMSAT